MMNLRSFLHGIIPSNQFKDLLDQGDHVDTCFYKASRSSMSIASD